MPREIKVLPGSNLESVVYTLLAAKERGESVYCFFNNHRLDSDTVSMDSAYMTVMGVTKAEYDVEMQKILREKELEKQNAKANIPNWIEEGKKIIYPERYEEWEECVGIRASDIYHGRELDNALEIMMALEEDASMEEVKEIFDKQNHSGASAGIVRSIVFSFSNKGPEFWEATNYGEISKENKQILEAKKLENIVLAQINLTKLKGSR